MVVYGTRREREELEIIRRKAPGAEIVNPAHYSGDPSKTHEHMEFYHGLVDDCDVVVYSDIGGEFISAGVGQEVEYALERGKSVYRIDHKARRLVRVYGGAGHLSRTGTRLLYRTMKWSGLRGEDLNKMVRMKIAEFGGRLSEEDALLMVAADLGVNTKTFLNNALKEAPEKIKAENKPSLFALEGFVSTFPKHQQNRYSAYRRALELHQQGGLSKWAIAKELNYPYGTVNTWITEGAFSPIERRVRELRDLGLYPLTSDNQHLPFIALLAGWILGDGHLTKNLYEVDFYDEEKESLENLRTLIQTHFPKISLSEVEKHREENEYRLMVRSATFAHFFATLGVPAGNKTEVPFSVPRFVLNGSDEVKGHFLAGIIPSEMDTPKLVTPHASGAITFGMSKIESLENEHIRFLEQIRTMLNDFEVKSSDISKVTRSDSNPRYVFSISGRGENLIKFFEKISLEFFVSKQRGKEDVMEALKYHIERAELYRRALALKAEGKKPVEISRELEGVPYQTVYKWIRGESKPILAKNAETPYQKPKEKQE